MSDVPTYEVILTDERPTKPTTVQAHAGEARG